MKENTHIVIMAGGIGSRLWPLSTPSCPKQFIDILGVGKSLIQLTVDRFLPLAEPEHFWVVTSAAYVGLVKEQLPAIPEQQILAEPEARNTAPCIAYACTKIRARYPDANIVVTPADAIVLKTAEFAAVLGSALAETAETDHIVTVGIAPTRPETGYGYIHAVSAETGRVVDVSEFREKPDLATAKEYLADGKYFWNAGIFVWNVRTIEAELRRHAPQIMGIMDRLAPYLYTKEEAAQLAVLFPQCDKISIDYAVMEKSDKIRVIAADLGWSDLGSWGSVKGHLKTDAAGNAVVGEDVRLFGTEGTLVHAAGARTVVVDGLKDYIVVEREGLLLICPLANEQRIKEYSAGK